MLEGVSGTGLIGEVIQAQKDMAMASVARMAKSAEVGVEEELFSKLKQIIISQGYSSGK